MVCGASAAFCESPWSVEVEGRGSPGALCAAAVFPRSPLRLAKEYSKQWLLTVMLGPQVQNSSVTRLWLILASPGASGGGGLVAAGLHSRPLAP
jgi:hypothetical protein